MGFTERRKNKRVADALALSIEPVDSAQSGRIAACTYVVKLSTNGLRFSSPRQLTVDTPVRVALHLDSRNAPVRLHAQVVYCAGNQPNNQIGPYHTRLIFKDVNNQTKALLEQHIEKLLTQTQVIKELPYRQIA